MEEEEWEDLSLQDLEEYANVLNVDMNNHILEDNLAIKLSVLNVKLQWQEGNELEKEKISIIAVIANFVLAISKIVIGMLSKSSAVIAEGVHSGMDIIFCD